MKVSRAALAKIHIAKKQLGLDEETYRDCVETVSRGRTRTAADLYEPEIDRLIKHFKTVGFRPRARDGKQLQALKGQIMERSRKLGDNWRTRLDGLCLSVTGLARVEWIKEINKARQLLAVIDSVGARIPENRR